jgi:hypothetical protein
LRDRLAAVVVAVPFGLGLLAAPTTADDVAFRFADRDITESSAFVVDGDLAYTSNDSGDSGRVFTVSLTTGETVGVTHWEDDPTDVEALAPAGRGEVWVGDIGDNQAKRRDVGVTRVPVGRGERTGSGTTYHLTYPDGPADAETLLCDPATGRLYVVTKEVFAGNVYAAPARLSAIGPNVMTRIGVAPGIATDGAFLPDGRHVVDPLLPGGGGLHLAGAGAGGVVRAARPAAGRGHRGGGRRHAVAELRGGAQPRPARAAAGRRTPGARPLLGEPVRESDPGTAAAR